MKDGDERGKKEARGENVRMSAAMAVGGVKSEIMTIRNPSAETRPTLCTHCQRTSNPGTSLRNLSWQSGNTN